MGPTLRRWRKLLHSKPLETAAHKPQPTIDLDQVAATVYPGCMGLPQELIEHIVYMLQDNRGALKACSLTCKAMFASARHLIHHTFHLTTRNNGKILTPAEKTQYAKGGKYELELRFLSFMAERGLLKYARHLNIDMQSGFFPHTLEPHLHHFPSLDRVHTLTVHTYNYILWRDMYNSLFARLGPTLTTLVLCSKTGYCRSPLMFILQFPNLQNLTLESFHHESWIWPRISFPSSVSQSPPLSGHLRCASCSPGNPVWPRDFPSHLQNGINFRSVEFQDVHCDQGQQILDMCAGSLEKFIIRIDRKGHGELGHLRFQKNVSLQSVVIRTPFSNLSGLRLTFSCATLLDDASLSLSEFALELSGLPSEFTQSSRELWGYWDVIDNMFQSFLRLRPEFAVVIRTGRVYNRDQFEAQAKEIFPSMARRGRIRFETSLTIDK